MQCRLANDHAHHGHSFAQISKGCVAVLGQPSQYWTGMGFDPMRLSVSTKRAWPQMALALLQMTPPADTGRTHAEPIGRFAMRCASRDRGQDPLSKIYRKGFRHIRRPPSGRSFESEPR